MHSRTSWRWAAIAGLTLIACERIASRVTNAADGVVQIVVRPDSVALDPQQTQQFQAFGRTAAGDSVATTVSWSASAGTITQSGLYTADTSASDDIVTASQSVEQLSGTGRVKKKRLVQVRVAPASVTLAAGGVQQFSAWGVKNTGDSVAVTVTYTATGGTITATGLYTAGPAGGAFHVTAKQTGGTLADSSAVTVITVPVAAVTVSPATASVAVGATTPLVATPVDAAGTVLSGRTITWASTPTSVATVNGTGLVTGVQAGSATVTATSEGKSGTSAITVTALPPPSASCLTQTGPTVTLSGLRTANYENTSLADNTKVDASTAQFLVATSVNIPLHIGGGASLCWSGGQVVGQSTPNTIWNTMHDRYAMVVGTTGGAGAPNMRVEGLSVFDYGDGISFDSQGDANWSIKNVHVRYSRDDCIENDFLNSGTIDSSFFDGCYSGMSSQSYYTPTQDGSNNLVVIKNSLMRLQDMDQAYSGPIPNGNPLWKWDALGPKLALYNNVFRADSKPWESSSDGIRETMAPPAGKLADCQNNVMVWLGQGAFPYSFPLTFNGKTCFTIMTGQAGLDYWNNAVAQWQANHPTTLPDIGPPIVSLFSPGLTGSTTLTGTVTLTATAVDDRAVAGVQFRLNGQSIAAEVTTESPTTKYSLSWDSHVMANGTYTLTATARDASGNTTTSAGVTVTVSN